MHLANRGHHVIGVDNFSRRKNVAEVGSWSATPIGTMDERLSAFKELHGTDIEFHEGDIREYHFVKGLLTRYKPDTIAHLGEQPCAPYSMIDVEHCVYTMTNNIVGTLNILYAMHESSPNTHCSSWEPSANTERRISTSRKAFSRSSIGVERISFLFQGLQGLGTIGLKFMIRATSCSRARSGV